MMANVFHCMAIKRFRLRCLFAAALCCCASAQALTLRLCADERSHMPFINASGGGMVGMLIQQAAQETGVTVQYYGAPITRCREELRANLASGFPGVPLTPSVQSFMAFPMQAGEIDNSRAVMNARALVYRRVGSSAGWDGKKFTDVSTPVMVPMGSVLLFDRLTAMGVPFDDGSKTLEGNFNKLLGKRGELVVGSEFSGAALLADPRFAGKIEALPLPFSDEAYFLALTKAIYDANPDTVERLWNALARIRKSAAYQQVVQKMLAEMARAPKE